MSRKHDEINVLSTLDEIAWPILEFLFDTNECYFRALGPVVMNLHAIADSKLTDIYTDFSRKTSRSVRRRNGPIA